MIRYVGTGRRRACSHSCSSVFASLAQLATSVVSMISPKRLCTRERAALKPPPRKGAPSSASSASARIDARIAPPPRASPSPSRSDSGRPSCSAARCRLSSRTRWARTRVRSPSSESPRRSKRRLETTRLRTASPRNSRRSLWSAPELRCVSARTSSAGSAKRWPMRCCSASRRESMRETAPFEGQAAQLVGAGAALELDEKEDGLHKFHFLVVGEGDDHLVVLLGDHQVLGADRHDRVFDVLLALEGVADLGNRRALGRDLVDRPLDREVLVEGRQHPHPDKGQEPDDDGPEQQAEEGHAALPARFVDSTLTDHPPSS